MATLTHHPSDAHHEPSESMRRVRAIIAGSSGNLVEWYDFYVYSFTALYFAAEFFPKGNQTTQLLNAAGVFAAGFLMRPVGSWLFGWLAETPSHEARKRSDAGTLRGMFRYPRSFFVVMGFTAAGSLTFYAFTTYMQKYLVNTAGFDARTATSTMTAALFCFMVLQPV